MNKNEGWTTFGKERAYFPRAGDRDVFLAAEPPHADEGFEGKWLVRTTNRLVSAYKSQLDPIGAYFNKFPKIKSVGVGWVADGNKVVPNLVVDVE